jgi:hypothetical protein
MLCFAVVIRYFNWVRTYWDRGRPRPPQATRSLEVRLNLTTWAMWHSTKAGEPSTPADRKTSAGDPAARGPSKRGPAKALNKAHGCDVQIDPAYADSHRLASHVGH